ncbi:hypothetical protein OAM79_02630 [Litorivicinus sp.]|nr:hypothetical protein [Litorivicinus sp.]
MFYYRELTTSLPNTLFVPSSMNQFIQSGTIDRLHWRLKFAKRVVVYLVIGRLFGLVPVEKNIATAQRVLWINFSAPSLGDSLMDLSARVLLADKEVDLFTSPKNSKLYRADSWFKNVFDRADHVGRGYDVVICDSYAPRVLWKKFVVAPVTPFTSMYGFLNGFDLNRTYFAFARMLQLLGKTRTTYAIRPYLSPSMDIKTDADLCIAVGGEWSFRTYRYWDVVIKRLISLGVRIHLVGGPNARTEHETLTEKYPAITSSVGNRLDEVTSEIANTPIFMGADGGLWHIACAVNRPTVALFADCEMFDGAGNRVMRDTADLMCETLYDSYEVSNIDPHTIIEAYVRLRDRLKNL